MVMLIQDWGLSGHDSGGRHDKGVENNIKNITNRKKP